MAVSIKIATFAASNLKFVFMKVTLRLSNKKDSGGRSEILLSAKRKVAAKVITMYAKSEVYTLPVFFDEVKGIDLNKKRTIAPDVRKFHSDMQERLSGVLKAIDDAFIKADKNTITKDWMEKEVHSYLYPAVVSYDFYDLFKEFLDKHGFSQFSVNVRQSLEREVFRFEKYRQLTEDPTFVFNPSTITKDDIEDLESFMLNEVELMGEDPATFNKIFEQQQVKLGGMVTLKAKGKNTVVSAMNQLKAFFNWLVKFKDLKNKPFEGIEAKRPTWGNVIYPTIEERDTIYSTPMPTLMLTLVRDAWVLQSVLGCRVSDLHRLTEGNITNGFLTYTPRKTKDETQSVATVPINDLAAEIIEKYRGQDRKGRLMPFPSVSATNENIKKVFALAGVNRMVEVRDPLTGENVLKPISSVASSHMARRCFIGNLYKEIQDPNIIAKMSGHVEGSLSFSRYRKIEKDTLKNVVSKIGKGKTQKSDTREINSLVAQIASLNPTQLEAIKNIINNK